MNRKQKNILGCIVLLVVMVSAQIIPTFAEQKAVFTADGPQFAEYAVSENILEATSFNKDSSGLYFGEYGEGKKATFAYFFYVEKDGFQSSFNKYDVIENSLSVDFLFRVKDESNTADKGWYGGNVAVRNDFRNDNSSIGEGDDKKEYVYLVLDVYTPLMKACDGLIKNLENKELEIIVNFYEKGEKDRELVASSAITEKFTSQMFVSWRKTFADLSGIELSDGKIPGGSFSIFDIIKKPMGFLLSFFYKISSNYLFSIVLFAIIIKIILFFATGIKQQKNMIKNAMFAPKQMAIQNKYKGRTDQKTMTEMRQEIQTAQQEAGVNPLGGGCISLLLQMLILICLYNVIRYPLTYLSDVPASTMSLIKQFFVSINGKTYDDIAVITPLRNNFETIARFLSVNFDYSLSELLTVDELPDFVLFKGFDMGATPSFDNFNSLLLVPVLVFFSYFFSMRLTRKMSYQPPKMEGAPDAAASLKIMDFAMPAISTFICFSVPALLGIYWIFSSLLGILQQYLLSKFWPIPKFTEEDYKAAEREYKGKTQYKAEEKKALRSSSYDDDDEEYAVLEDKKSYYDMTDEEKKAVDEKLGKTVSKARNKNASGNSVIEKAEMKDDSGSEDNNNSKSDIQ